MRSYSILALATIAVAQDIIPADLQTDFTSALSVQASFVGTPSEGFNDGDTLTKSEVQNNPLFALGDASGLNSEIAFAILLLDLTCPQTTLHFAQGDFKASNVKTQIQSNEAEALQYIPPGAFGETGERKLAFLMYIQDNPQQQLIGLPARGASFDVKSFAAKNNMGEARAGVSFRTNLGGSTNCGAVDTTTSSSTPPSTPPSTPSTPPSPSPSSLTTTNSSTPLTSSPSTIVTPPSGNSTVTSKNGTNPQTSGLSTTPKPNPSTFTSEVVQGGSTSTSIASVTSGSGSSPSNTPAAGIALGADVGMIAAIGLGALGALM